jgi:23S rRNA (uracil1939-C5)-methyltransferase
MRQVERDVVLRVEGLSFGGSGVAHLNGVEVLVAGAAPQETVRVRLPRTSRKGAQARLISVEDPSPVRVAPRCPHFGICGGCLWQHVDYSAQAQAKEAIVAEKLGPLGGGAALPVRPIVVMDDPWTFRNKMEFSFQPPHRLGLHQRGRWDEVIDVQTCFLPSRSVMEIVAAVRAFVVEHDLVCYDTRKHEGFLRHLVVREGRATGELMVAIVTAPGPFAQAAALADRLVAQHPQIASFIWAINATQSDAVEVSESHVLHGRPFIFERLGGRIFKVGLLTFFQTNTAQAERMIDVVAEFAHLRGAERVLDLYCGVGTFALALSAQASDVVGVDASTAAVEAARENAALNGVPNATFHSLDVGHLEEELPPRTRFDVVILDPPRAGAGARVMRAIRRLAPTRMVYVSCNPTTLAADLQELISADYAIEAIQPLDLFPHTYHVECVVGLRRISAG